MPASTLDPVNAAIRNSLSKTASETNLDVQLAGTTKKALLADIEFEAAGSYQSTVLDKLKSKYIVLKSSEPIQTSETEKMGGDETLTLAKHELYPLEAVQLGWGNTEWVVGAGMVNMGNTCYLNSTLQALFHVPALVNWLVSDKQHMSQCEDSGGLCIICAMRKTLQDSQQRNTNSIRPFLIYNKLRVVCRNLIPGRQEDAHEFLRYLVEAMEKAYLRRFKNYSEFDSRTKETTPLNQILGGYLRSAVRCLECGHVSTTFQHFQDLLLDIRKAQTLEEALDGYFSREKLDDESYHCESCQKKVPATKQFSLERAPMVLCIQLKRFSVSNNKITKHVQFRPRLELTKYARHRPSAPLVYRFVALVTHMGPTVGCGHYTAVAQAPCGNYYQFDDSMVRPISHQAVFNTNAYIMLYELEHAAFPAKTQNSVVSSSSTASPSSTCASGKAKATVTVNDGSANTNIGAANCYSNANNSITAGSSSGAIAVHYSNKSQQQDCNSDGAHDKSNNKSSSILNRNRLQLNGSRVYRSERSAPNLDPVATTSAPYGHNGTSAASSSAGNGGNAGNNGLPRHCHVRKVNGGTTLFSSSSSTSSSSDSDSEQQQRQKTQDRQQITNSASITLLQDKNVTPAITMSAINDSSTKNKSLKNSSPKTTQRATGGGSGDADSGGGTNRGGESNAITSLARSCSSSSVSSLSSNVEVGDGGSPPSTIPSPSATTSTPATPTTITTSSRASQSVTTKLVPYDVDDDDEDDAEDEYNDNADSESNSSDSSGCGGRRGSTTVGFLGTQSAINSPSVTATTLTVTTPTIAQSFSNSVERHRVTTKATTADWQVTSSEDLSLSHATSNEGRSWTKKTKTTFSRGGSTEQGNTMTTSSSAVGELLKMSHTGYSAPVNSWAGTRAALDKEVNEERREERKRLTTCDEMDRGRVKHIKTTNENNSNYSNPGYNRLQEFHNAKNSWNQHNIGNNNNGTSSSSSSSCSSLAYGGGGRQFYNTSGKHRNRRNNYHHKNNNYHKSNYTFRQ